MQFLENSHSRLTKNRQNLFLTLLATIISFCLVALPCMARPVELRRALSNVEVVLEACSSDSKCDEGCDSFDGGKTAAKRPWVTKIGPKTVSSCSSKAEGYSYASTKQVYSWADNAGEKDPKDSEGMSFATSGGTFKSPKGYGTLVLNWEVSRGGIYHIGVGFDENEWIWSSFIQGKPQQGGILLDIQPGWHNISLGGTVWTDHISVGRVTESYMEIKFTDAELLLEDENKPTKRYKDYTETVKGKKGKKKKKTGTYAGAEAATDWGYRVKRMKEGVDGWIAGDFYRSSDNAPYLLKNGGFRWLNYSLDADGNPVVADMYTYDPDTDTVEKRQYSSEGIDALKQELEDAANESRDPILPEAPKWTGSPAENPDDLANVPLSGTQSTTVAPQSLANQQGDLQEIKTRSPGAWLEFSNRNDNDHREWRYTLNVNSILGAHVSPGDRISIESSEIQSGSVEGDAATASKGSWQIVGTETGFLTFEATTHAYLDGSLGDFVTISGTNTQKGEINYTDEGDWIGYADTVEGPIPVGPDLTSIPEGDYMIGPKGKKDGKRVNATLEVWNQGNEDAGEFTVKVFLSDDENLDDTDILKQTLNVEGLATGVSSSLKININHTSSMKGKYLIASIDSDAQVGEAREDNNLAVGQIY